MISWCFMTIMVFDDIPWCFHDVSWLMTLHDVSWCFTKFADFDIWWCFMIFHVVFDISWFFMMFHAILWCFTKFSCYFIQLHDVSCRFMMFHGISFYLFFFTSFHDVSSDCHDSSWYSHLWYFNAREISILFSLGHQEIGLRLPWGIRKKLLQKGHSEERPISGDEAWFRTNALFCSMSWFPKARNLLQTWKSKLVEEIQQTLRVNTVLQMIPSEM